MKITRGQDWEVSPPMLVNFSRYVPEFRGVSTESTRNRTTLYYSLEGKCFTVSKPHTTPDGTYIRYNEITYFDIPRRGVSPDREIVGPEKVIVLE